MRLLLTTDTIGGVWTFSGELAVCLLEMGHAVALVSFGRPPSREQRAWCAAMRRKYGCDFRYDASSAPLEWMTDNAGAYTQAEPLLLGVADDFGPDVLHSNQFCFGRLPVDIPRVITAHSDVFSWAAACRAKGLHASPWLRRYEGLMAGGLGAADAVVAPTRWMLGALGLSYGTLPGHVILNGRSLPRPADPGTRRLEAISVGRLWDEAKNLAVLTEAQSPFPMSVAGELDFERRGFTEELGSIRWLGVLDEASLHRCFRASSVYVATSIYEPFGLAPLEAALCGCAVVANDIPSLREVWGDAALYFRDAAGLTRLLRDLWDMPRLLEETSRRCRRRALQFSAARMTEKYVELYASLGARVGAKEAAAYVS